MIRVRDIQLATAEHYGLPVEIMFEPCGRGANSRERAWPRQEAILLSRRLTRHSKSRIGQLFNRNHSTIIASIRRARRRCLNDREYLKAVCQIRARLLENAR